MAAIITTRQPHAQGKRSGSGSGKRQVGKWFSLKMGRRPQPARPSKGREDGEGFNGEKETRVWRKRDGHHQ